MTKMKKKRPGMAQFFKRTDNNTKDIISIFLAVLAVFGHRRLFNPNVQILLPSS